MTGVVVRHAVFGAEVSDPADGTDIPRQSESMTIETATGANRARALMRLRAVERSDALRADGWLRADADATAAEEAGVSVSAVGSWRKRVKGLGGGRRVEALLDALKCGRPRNKWSGTGAEALWQLWRTDWLREEAPDAAAVHRRIAAVAEAKGWNLPGLDAFRRRAQRELPRAEIVRARDGALAAMDMAPHQTRSVAGLVPLDIVNGDGRRHDVLVTLPSGREGRPVVWMWQDVRTRRILAWRAGETESADLVRTSLHALISEHGVPGRVLVDSTRAASAKWATGGQRNRRRWRSTGEELPGLLQLLEIKYTPTTVDTDAGGRGKGRGRAKPIERAFGDLARQIDTHPALADEIGRTVVRRLSPSQAAILLLAAEDVLVDRSGCVRLKAGRGSGLPANRYHSSDLVERAGNRVVARFDPADLHAGVRIFDLQGRHICRADCLMPVGFADGAKAGEYQRARRQQRKSTEKALAARRDMDGLLDMLGGLPTSPRPEPARPAAVGLVAGSPAASQEVHDEVPRRRSKFMSAAIRHYGKESG